MSDFRMQRIINENMYIGDPVGFWAAFAQNSIDCGFSKFISKEAKECWLIENTHDAMVKPTNFEEI